MRRALVFSLWALIVGAQFIAPPAVSAAAAQPQAPATSLEDVLSRMDQAAAGFQGVVADLTSTKVTVIVNDRSVEKGIVYFKCGKGKHDFKVKIDFREPSQKIVLFTGDKGYIYRPAIAQVEEYDLGKNRQAVEQFLMLGFGSGGHELLNSYNITLAGEAKIGDVDTIKLELLPKSPGLARYIKKFDSGSPPRPGSRCSRPSPNPAATT